MVNKRAGIDRCAFYSRTDLQTPERMSQANDARLYFGYASNMLWERININNPTARCPQVGKLKGYSFSFETGVHLVGLEEMGTGATATLINGGPDDCVYGVVWTIDSDQIKNLDRQEVGYDAKLVEVELADGSTEICRTFLLTGDFTGNRKPYPCYKKIIAAGAKQNGLPDDYVRFLEGFEDSGNTEVPPYLQKTVEAMQK